MSAQQLNALWDLVRKNEQNIALLAQKVGDQSDTIKKLKEDNDAMRAILNQAIGAKTMITLIGAFMVSVITWAVTYFCGGRS